MASEHTSTTKITESKTPAGFRPGAGQDAGSGHAPRQPAATLKEQVSRATESIAKASELYKENTEFTAERLKTLLSAYVTYARGLQEMQKTYVDLVHRSIELAQRATRELIRCTSAADVAELQRDLLHQGLDEFFESSTKILQASSKAADDAVRPIEEQIKHAA